MPLININSKNIKKSFFFSSFILLAYFVSSAIIDRNYYIMVGILGLGMLIYLFEKPEKTIFLLFFGILFLDWLSEKWFLIPRQITWLPELLSIIVLLYIILSFAILKKIPLKGPYILVYIFIGLTFLGIILNKVPFPVAIAGIRNHLKFLPFFLIPFYYDFSDEFMEKFVKFIFFFSFLQCPVAVFQRLLYETGSGDPVGGTLGAHSSGILSIFCSFMVILWTAYYFKCQIKSKNYLLGLIVLFIPMGLSETKLSIFLIPLIFFSIIFFIPEAKKRIRYFVLIFISFAILLGLYRFIYNYYYAKTPQRVIETYIKSPGKTLDEIYYKTHTKSGRLNKIPQIIFAYQNINKDLIYFFFGVGAGNASDSFFSTAGGKYYNKYWFFGIDNIFIANMLWEYGIVGTSLYLLIVIFIFDRVFSLRNNELINGNVAIGFLGMSAVLLMSMVYLNTMRVNLYLYLYWFLAGYLINVYYYKRMPAPQNDS